MLQIDLDRGEGQIKRGIIADDIRAPCTCLDIEFHCSEKLDLEDFTNNYFRYKNIDWACTSVKSTQQNDGLWYIKCSCYPYSAFKMIKEPCDNTVMLAGAAGLSLNKDSVPVKIWTPVINMLMGLTVQTVRKSSLDVWYSRGDIGQAGFIYFNDKSLLSVPWKSLVSQTPLQLESTDVNQGSNEVSFIGDIANNYFRETHQPKPWMQTDYLSRLMGQKVEIRTSLPSMFLSVYAISFVNSTEEQVGKYMCVRSALDITSTYGFLNTYALINLDWRK